MARRGSDAWKRAISETKRRNRPPAPALKYCAACDQTKPVQQFYRAVTGHRAGKLSFRCKPCFRRYTGAWRRRNPELVRGMLRRRRLASYGLSEREYQRLFEAQRGVCAICERPETTVRGGKGARLSVDHEHKTDRVRGLLCHACNLGLGKFGDSPQILVRAAQYLAKRGNTS